MGKKLREDIARMTGLCSVLPGPLLVDSSGRGLESFSLVSSLTHLAPRLDWLKDRAPRGLLIREGAHGLPQGLGLFSSMAAPG